MYLLYGLLILMLASAVGLLAVPYALNRGENIFSKGFFAATTFIILSSLCLYQFTGDKVGLALWMTKGSQHYQLLEQIDNLGGIDQIITRIEAKVKANPDDAQGWFILGKLYLATHDMDKAKDALKKAHDLQPQNSEINKYYMKLMQQT